MGSDSLYVKHIGSNKRTTKMFHEVIYYPEYQLY